MSYLDAVADPFASSHRIKYYKEAEEAKQSPGQWFRLHTKGTPQKAWNDVQQIKNGRRVAFRPAGTFDAVARGADVLIMYVGEDVDDDPQGASDVKAG